MTLEDSDTACTLMRDIDRFTHQLDSYASACDLAASRAGPGRVDLIATYAANASQAADHARAIQHDHPYQALTVAREAARALNWDLSP